jgi:hypothetical protein
MPTIEISEETYEKIKDQLTEEEAVEINSYSDMVGKVAKQVGDFLMLENASWVADSGRFTQAIKQGKLNEVEPVGNCGVNLKAVTDFFPWKHLLPKEQK